MEQIRDLMRNALKIGEKYNVDEMEVYGARSITSRIRIGNNSLNSSFNIMDKGIGIRLIKDEGLGFSAISLTNNKQELEKAILDAVSASKIRKPPFQYNLPELKQQPKIEALYDKKLENLSEEEKSRLALRMLNASNDYSQKVSDNSGRVTFITYETVIKNLQGETVTDIGTKIEASLTASAKEHNETSEDNSSRNCRTLDVFEPEKIGSDAASNAVDRLKAVKIEEGSYDMIIDPPSLNWLCYWFLRYMNPAYAETYYPTLKDRIGSDIASPELSIIDDPTYPGGYNSYNVDDEGVMATPTPIVEDGVLMNFIYDTYSAARSHVESTGNALRTGLWFVINFSLFPGKNYNYEPYPEFSNMMVKPGDRERAEMIEETKHGVVTNCFHYSRVSQHIRGDFTAILGRWRLHLVEDGEIIAPIKKCRLNDNIFNMMKNVDAVGNNLYVDDGIAPTIRTKNVNIVSF